ncbi:MAG: hypothetical protein HYS07_09415, partial [Chlamydiae bacterium]|nr:hypothetical protein [Chlamydiota bacterium]MBI3277751.1 hypothetical protein [Chlamydiota bacterium]
MNQPSLQHIRGIFWGIVSGMLFLTLLTGNPEAKIEAKSEVKAIAKAEPELELKSLGLKSSIQITTLAATPNPCNPTINPVKITGTISTTNAKPKKKGEREEKIKWIGYVVKSEEARGMRDEGQSTRDEGRSTKDERRRTRNEGRGTKEDELIDLAQNLEMDDIERELSSPYPRENGEKKDEGIIFSPSPRQSGERLGEGSLKKINKANILYIVKGEGTSINFTWNGKDRNGVEQSEGSYIAGVIAKGNGSHTKKEITLTIDTTSP